MKAPPEAEMFVEAMFVEDALTNDAPGGRLPLSRTLAAALGPLLTTLIVLVKSVFVITAVLKLSATPKSAAAETVVIRVAELLLGCGSTSSAVTVEVAENTPSAAGIALIVAMALPPGSNVPKFSITTLLVVNGDTIVILCGKTLLTIIPVAGLGPLLVTDTVYVSDAPILTGSGEEESPTRTSAVAGFTCTVTLTELSDVSGSTWSEATVALDKMGPVTVGRTLTTAVAQPGAGTAPKLRVTTPAF